jgi:uroporphyrinogen-III decarboxylase
MTPDEKQEALFAAWLSPKDAKGDKIKFSSHAAEQQYTDNITRIKDAIQMKKTPDRVPVYIFTNMFPVYYSGITVHEVMYNYDACYRAWKKYVLDFNPDAHTGCSGPGPGKFFEILDYKLYSWPGHGVAPEYCYQANEGEYMKVEEYDELIDDPSNFFSHVYLPRCYGKLDGFKMLPTLTDILEMYGVAFNFTSFNMESVQETYRALFNAGAETVKWAGMVRGFNQEMISLGYPTLTAGFSKAPFDVIGDTLRGTRGIMLDMYRCPEKLIEAMESITPLMIKMGVRAVRASGRPLVFMPLHKGADGFLSDEQYKRFYWPTFRKVLIGLIDEGCVPFPVAEGGYHSRLEIIKDLPVGKTVWMFDDMDMAKAKKTIGEVACITGNIPTDILTLGTPEQVKDYTKNLIDNCAGDGGYIMSNGAFLDEADPVNVKTVIDFTRQYGVYR